MPHIDLAFSPDAGDACFRDRPRLMKERTSWLMYKQMKRHHSGANPWPADQSGNALVTITDIQTHIDVKNGSTCPDLLSCSIISPGWIVSLNQLSPPVKALNVAAFVFVSFCIATKNR
jgi:hypothetical protein